MGVCLISFNINMTLKLQNGYKRYLLSLKYLLFIHLTALLILTLFRLALFLSTPYQLPEGTGAGTILPAFIRGIWFDNVISCYIMVIPLTAISIAALFDYYGKALWKAICVFFTLFYIICFAVTAANIPYFQYFFKVINSSIYNWFGYVNTTTEMMFGESSYYPPLFGFLVACVMFIMALLHFSRQFSKQVKQYGGRVRLSGRITVFVTAALVIGLCLFGIRGRTGYNPIKVSAAYYCTDPFLNQLGISPTFNLLSSTLDDNRKENRTLHLIPEDEAIAYVQKALNREGITGISPIAREVIPGDSLRRPNIVLIFMESMSANLMKRFGQEKTLTPFLDSLYAQSLGFPKFFSAGIHTNHGMYATLYSFPSIMKRNAMKGSVIPVYSGLPTVLQDNGYRTMFFMTHESQYDNMNAFFRTNGFEEIYAQEDYPADKVVSGFGVQDDFLYNYALKRLAKEDVKEKPFFTVLLSISNHPPYVIPPWFKPKSSTKEEQIVEYADWSIRDFMTKAAEQDWYDNTIFVLLGDHGKMVGNPDCEMPQSYNHIPLMIYSPQMAAGKEIPAFGGQIDVAPTLLGMLNIPYTQNNLGVDLMREKRPAMFFTADNLIGAKNENTFYIFDPENNQEFCYAIEGNGLHSIPFNSSCDTLKQYAFSMLQTTEYLVQKQLTTDQINTNSKKPL